MIGKHVEDATHPVIRWLNEQIEGVEHVPLDCRCPDCARMTRAVAVGERVAELEAELRSWFPQGSGPTLSVSWPTGPEAVTA